MKIISWNANHGEFLYEDIFDGSHDVIYMQRCPLSLAEKIRDTGGYTIWWHPQTTGEDAVGLLTASKGIKWSTNPRKVDLIEARKIDQTDTSQSYILQRMVWNNSTFVNFLPPFKSKGANIEYFQKLLKYDFEVAIGDTHCDLNEHIKPNASSPLWWGNTTPRKNQTRNRENNFFKPGEIPQILTWVMSRNKELQLEKVHYLGDNHVGHHPVEAWFDEL